MRGFLLPLRLVATATLATSVAAALPPETVYLNGAADLAKLRATNPAHAARAERIMAAANQLCRPTAGAVSEAQAIVHPKTARIEGQEIACADMLLKTSNPPKRQISFTLDGTRYIAMVAITDDPPKVVSAR
jgi:hypothetical protein